MQQEIQKTKLKNGITILTDKMPSSHSVAIGIWIPRGSRHESKENSGLSHFYEHLVFKGTKNRTAFEIASALEDRGGQLEAYTTRQETGFYAQVVPKDTFLALEVMADMIMEPLFAKKDISKERKVIIEEIRSYEDIAEECAADLFYATHYSTCGLSSPIAGTVSSVRRLTEEALLKYREQVISEIPLYICAAGNINHEKLVEKCKQLFHSKKSAAKKFQHDYSITPSLRISSKPDLQQSSLVFGTSFKKENLSADFRYILSLFNVAFGAGMSSRLFQKIREEHGLAYSVYSTTDVFSDSYGFSIALATDPNKLEKAFQLTKDEFQKFMENGFSENELKRTKRGILGSLEIGSDNTEKRLLRLAEHTLHFGSYQTIDKVKESFQNLDNKKILEKLSAAFDYKNFSAAIVQPSKTKKSITRLF